MKFGEALARVFLGPIDEPSETDSDYEIIRKSMPPEFRRELVVIENWAINVRHEAILDKFAYWAIKIPAILVSVSAAVLAHFKLEDYAGIASAIASACVLIDGMNPRGRLYNVHRKAAFELFHLHADMFSRWRVGRLQEREVRSLAVEIISQAQQELKRIGNYLTEAETSGHSDSHRPRIQDP